MNVVVGAGQGPNAIKTWIKLPNFFDLGGTPVTPITETLCRARKEQIFAPALVTLAGHYPAMRLGAPWWFFDSVLGFERYLDRVVETAGIYNLAGFNDDTRAFPSIKNRHDVWRRTVANWVAGMVERGQVDEDAAEDAVTWLAHGAARDAYRLGYAPNSSRASPNLCHR